MSKDAGEQAVEFFLKRADYSSGLALKHCNGMEYEKGANLYKEAYSFLKKAEQSQPSDPAIKSKIEEIKNKYQEAKKKCDEKK